MKEKKGRDGKSESERKSGRCLNYPEIICVMQKQLISGRLEIRFAREKKRSEKKMG